MGTPVIELDNVSKTFLVNRRQYGLKGALLHLPQYISDMCNPLRFTALHNVSFSIQPGETVALAGHNGCGKTTLLSLIGGVLKEYQGRVSVRGRVSMMLALGAGFCNELSGRENIILNGVMQGMSKKAMREKLDEIIEFTELGDFIDSPIYQYSSGMQVRLGFAVATAIEPEILLVDEVMAVGDAAFKKKCQSRIDNLLSRGTTLLLVSHNPNDVLRYCKRTIKLDHGKIIFDGASTELFGGEDVKND